MGRGTGIYRVSFVLDDGNRMVTEWPEMTATLATAFAFAKNYNQVIEIESYNKEPLLRVIYAPKTKESEETFLVYVMCNITTDRDSKDVYTSELLNTITMQKDGFYKVDFYAPTMKDTKAYVGNGFIVCCAPGVPSLHVRDKWIVANQMTLCSTFNELHKAKEYTAKHREEDFDELLDFAQLGYLIGKRIKY